MSNTGIGETPNYLVQVMVFARLSLAQLVRASSHSRRAEAARNTARRAAVQILHYRGQQVREKDGQDEEQDSAAGGVTHPHQNCDYQDRPYNARRAVIDSQHLQLA